MPLKRDIQGGPFWEVCSDIKKFDGIQFSSDLPSAEVVTGMKARLVVAGYKSENIKFEDYTDQIHGYIRYGDRRWRRVINIVYGE